MIIEVSEYLFCDMWSLCLGFRLYVHCLQHKLWRFLVFYPSSALLLHRRWRSLQSNSFWMQWRTGPLNNPCISELVCISRALWMSIVYHVVHCAFHLSIMVYWACHLSITWSTELFICIPRVTCAFHLSITWGAVLVICLSRGALCFSSVYHVVTCACHLSVTHVFCLSLGVLCVSFVYHVEHWALSSLITWCDVPYLFLTLLRTVVYLL